MFEEVPRERRGVARLLPVRRVVLGPFVLGGGMLLAALGGSVAVAAAATMITASAIGSDEAPDRPGHPVASSASSTKQAVSARQSPARHRSARPASTGRPPAPRQTGTPAVPTGAGVVGVAGSTSASEVTSPVRTPTVAAPTRTAGPTAPPSGSAGGSAPTPAPSSGAPLGNAVLHVSGYDLASQRLVYQFASAQPGADGVDVYQVSGPETFTAALAPSITITSGGSLCPPAGSACSVDELIRAAGSGFFAVAAIDVRGEIRSLIEVGGPSAAPKLTPAPSTEAADGNPEVRFSSAPPAPGTGSGSGS